MNSRPATASADPVWLHCSPSRTVWKRRAVTDEDAVGTDIVQKIYVAGSMSDAEHEFAMGKLAAGAGVVDYLSVDTDAQTGRPAVSLRFEQGCNLEAHVAGLGALPAHAALRLLEPVAIALHRLHSLRTDELPNGMCHGDVKPQNLLVGEHTTLLLDFEHARAIGSVRSATFTGGTSAYSPPEAHHGAAPDASFDVFAWGQTLHFALGSALQKDAPQHPEVEALLDACREDDPSKRPSAEELVATCRRLLGALATDDGETTLHDWMTGALQQSAASGDDPRDIAWHRRHRMLQSRPRLLDVPRNIENEPAALHRQLRANEHLLAYFPRHPAAVQRRNELMHATGLMLASAAEVMSGQRKNELFEEAGAWLQALEQLTLAALNLPGGLAAVTHIATDRAPSALQRTPIEFLQHLQEQLAGAREELHERCIVVDDAERQLDLTRVEELIDDLAADYGGTSPTVSQRRDQLHRLAFYLDRVARADANVERVGPLWDPIALGPLQQLVAEAAAATESRIRREGGDVGLRSLEITLANLCEEFPHLQQVPDALHVLTQALQHLTGQAWTQLADANKQLRLVPVPVRPLQIVLGRLDTFRTLEAFVDLPEQPRSDLLDGLERLRLGLEQARSARDRLAENAEHALARGHWTTGLFDMERAVADLHPGDDQERVEAERLRERLQVARRTKQEIETAVRRNVEQTARYSALEDDPQSTSEQRLQVLEDRRDCLTFLGMHVPNERAELYRKDLRSVETMIAIEQAAVAEQQLDATDDLNGRLRLTRDTLERLSATTASSGGEQPQEPSGRMVRLLEHWRTLTRQCQHAVEEAHAEELQRQRQRKRMLTLAIAAILVTTTAIGFAIKPWLFGTPVEAGEKNK